MKAISVLTGIILVLVLAVYLDGEEKSVEKEFQEARIRDRQRRIEGDDIIVNSH